MTICVLRVAMPDRPGALGAVASRIGAVRGDVVEIRILNRVGGHAKDEIAVDIDKDLLPLLLSEVAEVDGVEVEQVRLLPNGLRDRRLDAYLTAEALLEAVTPDELLVALAERARIELEATWTAVFDIGSISMIASTGRPPGLDWMSASYRRHSSEKKAVEHPSGGPTQQPADLIWAQLDRFDAAVAAGQAMTGPSPNTSRRNSRVLPVSPTFDGQSSATDPQGSPAADAFGSPALGGRVSHSNDGCAGGPVARGCPEPVALPLASFPSGPMNRHRPGGPSMRQPRCVF